MPQAIIYLDEELNKKIETISKEFKLSKYDVIVKILNEFELEEKDGHS